jgi:hypothetical protein
MLSIFLGDINVKLFVVKLSYSNTTLVAISAKTGLIFQSWCTFFSETRQAISETMQTSKGSKGQTCFLFIFDIEAFLLFVEVVTLGVVSLFFYFFL